MPSRRPRVQEKPPPSDGQWLAAAWKVGDESIRDEIERTFIRSVLQRVALAAASDRPRPAVIELDFMQFREFGIVVANSRCRAPCNPKTALSEVLDHFRSGGFPSDVIDSARRLAHLEASLDRMSNDHSAERLATETLFEQRTRKTPPAELDGDLVSRFVERHLAIKPGALLWFRD